MTVRTFISLRGLDQACAAGGVYEFIRDTLDPLASAYLFKTQNYFYLLVREHAAALVGLPLTSSPKPGPSRTLHSLLMSRISNSIWVRQVESQ
jgi:hypothetical protein